MHSPKGGDCVIDAVWSSHNSYKYLIRRHGRVPRILRCLEELFLYALMRLELLLVQPASM